MTDDEEAISRAAFGEHWCWELHRNLASVGEYDKRQLRGGAIERAWPHLCSSESEISDPREAWQLIVDAGLGDEGDP